MILLPICPVSTLQDTYLLSLHTVGLNIFMNNDEAIRLQRLGKVVFYRKSIPFLNQMLEISHFLCSPLTV